MDADLLASRTGSEPVVASTAAPSTHGGAARIGSFWMRYHVRLIAAGLALAFLLNYLSTLAPTVLALDSGRFQARAYVLGIGHPTGYPTYIMLGKLFTYLPVGDVAYRVNLSSAVYGVAAVVLLYFVALRLSSTLPAALAAVAFGTSRAFWSQTAIAEIYTLSTLFVCAVLLALLVWRDTRNSRYLLLAAFLTGLAMTNHLTTGLLIPAAAVFVALTDRRLLLSWKLLLKCAGLFLLGLTPYLYLPIRASMNPPLNYGDPSNLHNFLILVTGRQFRDRMWAYGIGDLPERWTMYRRLLGRQYSIVLIVSAVLGLAFQLWRRPATWALLATLFVGELVYALEYKINDIFVYFIPTYVVVALWMAVGLQALLALLAWLPSRPARMAGTIALSVVALVLIGAAWRVNYPSMDLSNTYGYRRLLDRVASTPANAVIYDTGSTTPLQYLRYVEHRRLDLRIRPVRRGTVEQSLEQDLGMGHAVYFMYPNYRKLLSRRYYLQPESGLWRVVPKGSR